MPRNQNGKPSAAESAATIPVEIDLNSAPETELAALPALGPERARILVQFRPFDYWTDLRRIPGFSASVIGDLRDIGARLEPAASW